MTTKEDVIRTVRLAAVQGLIGLDDLVNVYKTARGEVRQTKSEAVSVVDLLYFLGGAVVFIGIAVLLGQHWKELSFLAKITATLGMGTGTYVSGVFLSRDGRFEKVAQAFFLIAALLLPIGVGLLCDHAGMNTQGSGTQSLISGVLLTFFGASYVLYRTNTFLLFLVLYGTWFFHSMTSLMVFDHLGHSWSMTAMKWRALVGGFSYMCLGYAFSHDERRALTGFLYGFGVLAFLTAAYAFIGWKPNHNLFAEMLFPFIVFGVLFLSVYLKSSSFLTFGSLYLVAYIGKLTVDYFKNSLGWPLALVIMGFALMATGYGAFTIKRKYL